MSAESGFNWGYEGCFPCNSQTIMMGSHENCEWFDLPEYLHWDTGSSLGTINLAQVCYGQCHGQPELAPPAPKFTCHSSINCRDDHGLDHWMCNFDQDDSGFCEPCYQRLDNDRCIASTFATKNGTNECFKVCVDGNYGDLHPTTSTATSTATSITTSTTTSTTTRTSCSDFDLIHDFLAHLGAVHLGVSVYK